MKSYGFESLSTLTIGVDICTNRERDVEYFTVVVLAADFAFTLLCVIVDCVHSNLIKV